MWKWLKRGLLAIGALLLAMVLSFFVAYLVATPDADVPLTVEHDPGLPFIEVNGYRFHGETYGDASKPVVLVLHGGPGGDYRSLTDLKALSDDYFVVFYDQRGAGLSPRAPAEDLTMEQYLVDLDGIVEKFAADKKVHLVGHSFGAMLASAYLGKHPDKVAGAVLAEPGFLTPAMGQRFMERTNWMTPTGTGFAELLKMGRIWLESWKVPQVDGHEHLDYLFSHIMKMEVEGHPIAGYYCGGNLNSAHLPEWRFSGLTSQTMLSSAITPDKRVIADFSQGVEAFEGEVLFIASSCNTLIGAAVQREHMKLFKNASLEIIEDSGHTMFGEQPERSLYVVRKYLSRVQ